MLDFKNIIHIILIAESIIFALQLLTYRHIASKSAKILGLLMIFMAVYFSVSLLWFLHLYEVAVYAQYLMMPVFLALNPFYYIYVKSLTDDRFRFGKKTMLNFIPSFFILLLNLIFYSSLSSKDRLLLVSVGIHQMDTADLLLKINIIIDLLAVAVYYVQLVVYMILIIICLRKHTRNINNLFSDVQHISLNWLKVFVIILLTNTVLELFLLFAIFAEFFQYIETTYYILLLLLISFLGYFGLKQVDVYAGRVNKKTIITDSVKQEGADTVAGQNEIMTEPVLSESEQRKIVEAVIQLMETEKLFLKPDISVYDIAEKLKTNKTYISLAINNVLKKNFRNFVNEYRIKEAQRLFSDKEYDVLSIEGIARTVGYVSKSTFNASFKKLTGEKPSEYRRKCLMQRS